MVILATAQALVRFSMPEKWRQASLFSGHVWSSNGLLGDPMGPPKRSQDVDDEEFNLS